MFLEATKPQENRPVNESVSMNTTATGSSSWSCFSLINHEAGKIGATVAYSFILVVSLVGNFLIVLIVYKTPTLRKPINMLIANMAMSDLLYPIFTFPVLVVKVYTLARGLLVVSLVRPCARYRFFLQSFPC